MTDPNLTESGRLRSVSERLRRIDEVPRDLSVMTRVQLEVSLTQNLDRAIDDLVVARAEAELLKNEDMVLRCSRALNILRNEDGERGL